MPRQLGVGNATVSRLVKKQWRMSLVNQQDGNDEDSTSVRPLCVDICLTLSAFLESSVGLGPRQAKPPLPAIRLEYEMSTVVGSGILAWTEASLTSKPSWSIPSSLRPTGTKESVLVQPLPTHVYLQTVWFAMTMTA